MGQTYTIGLLSGTSADAIDGILIQWIENTPKIVSTHSLSIPHKLRKMVFSLAVSDQHEIEKLSYLDHAFAKLFSQSVQTLCEQSKLKPSDITAIGSHGQTIRHYPPSNKDTSGFSLQIGDPNIIAETTSITTVADLRRKDIAAGGQGAPLAPGLHKELFQSNTTDRVILNTGGIANITYLPANGNVIGFDTGPANGLMDSWCQLHKNRPYDENGHWASQGKIQHPLLHKLLDHPYFSKLPPKSTGREDFNLPWLQRQLEVLDARYTAVDVQASLLEFSAESIAKAVQQTISTNQYEIYICGGGAHNATFCDRLKDKLNPHRFDTTSALGIHPDWVEASCFAWIAKQTMEGKTSNVPSVTGARKEVILGGIYLS